MARAASPVYQLSPRQPPARSPEPCCCQYLFEPSLDAAVLAGDHLAVPVLRSAAGQAEVRVALPHGQVARALLGVALGLTAAAWEAVLTCSNTARGFAP